jgi:hypothetical protein
VNIKVSRPKTMNELVSEWGQWAIYCEDAIVEALKEAKEARSSSRITKFERALDSKPKGKARIHS